ncbi:hypothetical protein L873DRAFT_1828626 [Choiromyces venosus 120613-1]|uniref:ribonuclease H n=1 Tax=Choiromyces venosus 120613-1 TaxID=1336337 RepID=A0A3N4JIJ0_9PEZI|nr:hypothetical protein L873DRAFT_1828626 [Choiromyces venosus 120613-1]
MPRIPIANASRGVLSRLSAKRVAVKQALAVPRDGLNGKVDADKRVIDERERGKDKRREEAENRGRARWRSMNRAERGSSAGPEAEEYWPELVGVEEGHVQISIARLTNLATRPPSRRIGFSSRPKIRTVPKSSIRIPELEERPSLLPKLDASSDGLTAIQLINMAIILSSPREKALKGIRAVEIRRQGSGFEVVFRNEEEKLAAMKNTSWVSLLSGAPPPETSEYEGVRKGFGLVIHSVHCQGFTHAETKDFIKQLYTENPWDPEEITVVDARWIGNVRELTSSKRGFRSMILFFKTREAAATIQENGLFFNKQYRPPAAIIPLVSSLTAWQFRRTAEAVTRERLETNREVVIFTDGSKNGLEAGAAVWRKADSQGGEIKKMYGLGTRMSIYDAELYAVWKAIGPGGRLARERKAKKLTICADSQAALGMMARGTTGPGSHIALRGRAEMKELHHSHGIHVALEWVKSHAGIRGNIRVDKLARAACAIRQKQKDSYTSEILLERIRRKEEWVRGCRERRLKRWKSAKGMTGGEKEEDNKPANYVINTGYSKSPFKQYEAPLVVHY